MQSPFYYLLYRWLNINFVPVNGLMASATIFVMQLIIMRKFKKIKIVKLKGGIGILKKVTKQGEAAAVCIYIAVVILLKECAYAQNKYLYLEIM